MKNYRHRARALGAMALVLEKAKGDHAAAVRLPGEAFGVLDQAVDRGKMIGTAWAWPAWPRPVSCRSSSMSMPAALRISLANARLRPPIPGPNGRTGFPTSRMPVLPRWPPAHHREVGRQVFHGFVDRGLRTSDRSR